MYRELSFHVNHKPVVHLFYVFLRVFLCVRYVSLFICIDH